MNSSIPDDGAILSLSHEGSAVLREELPETLDVGARGTGGGQKGERGLEPEILRIIQLDLDLKYKTNIRELFEEFDNFLPGAVIGIAREMQPVYR
ncbi:hypothetical protein CB1_000389029 [Camelus ferus]|nr:hypothetical protein CB1_000389029 [Camelus ferus]